MLLQKNVESRLMARLYERSDKKDGENRFIKIPAIPTGFNVFDIYGGFLAEDMFGRQVLNGGLYPRLSNVIGESSTGKTSWVIRSNARAVDYIQQKFGQGYSEMFFYDSEDHTPDIRLMRLANWSPADFMNRCNYTNKRISLLQLYNQIVQFYDIKTKYKKDFLLPSGIRGIDGKEVLFIAPTFVCVDSVASVLTEGFESLVETDRAGEIKEAEALSNNIDAMREAKAWTVFTKKCKPFLDEANICLTMINHKTKEQKMSMFDQEKRYLPFLKPGEKLKGGAENIYQSFHVLDFYSGEKLNEKNPVYGLEIDGFVTRVQFVKSKSNVEGVSFPMVFEKLNGYNPKLSDFEYLWQNKYGFTGVGKMVLDVLPEISFTRKTLLDTMEEHPALARALSFTTRFKAAHAMLYYKDAPQLTDMGNLPLNERLAMIYAYTNPYDYNDFSSASSEYERVARQHRNLITFDMTSDLGQNLLQKHDLDSFKDGYLLSNEDGVTPYDLETNTRDGQYFYSSSVWKQMQEEQKTLAS